MTAITETFTSHSESHIRPFDPRRHLNAVADLIEVSFAETLDPDGKDYLQRMRSAANSHALASWISSVEWASPAMQGFVWTEGERVVGNASLIPYFIHGKRNYLIANVAVHPDYRRRGIGRNLTARSIEFIRSSKSPSAWLHVREDNIPAERLYRSMGFMERARRTTWLSHPDFEKIAPPPGYRILSPGRNIWKQQRRWLEMTYPSQLSWHMPIKIASLRPGWIGALVRFLYAVTIRQWAILRQGEPAAVLSWQSTLNYANALWLAAPKAPAEDLVLALISHARRTLANTRPLMLDYPAHQLEGVFTRGGFYAQQTLIWMELPLSA